MNLLNLSNKTYKLIALILNLNFIIVTTCNSQTKKFNELEKLFDKGYAFDKAGKYDSALVCYLKTLKVLQTDTSFLKFKAKVLVNISNIYLLEGNKKMAVSFSKMALNIYQINKDSAGIASMYMSFANLYNNLNVTDSAEYWFNKSAKLLQFVSDLKKAKYYNNLGMFYAQNNRYKKSLPNFLKSVEIKKTLKDDHGLCITYSNIAELYILLNNYNEAKKYADFSIEIAERINSFELLEQAYSVKAEVYYKIKDFENAYLAIEKNQQFKDSLFNNNLLNLSSEYEVKYSTELKENKIKQLEAKNKIEALKSKNNYYLILMFSIVTVLISVGLVLLAISNKKLKTTRAKLELSEKSLIEANSAKEKIFAILSHDVKSPLASLSTLLNMYDENPEMEKNHFDKFIEGIKISLNSVYFLIDNLLQWARTQLDKIQPEIVPVSLEDLFFQVEKQFQLPINAKKLKIKTEINNIVLNSDKSILEITLRNILSNAIKFSPKNGTIEILVSTDQNKTVVSIIDEGRGFDKNENFTQLNNESTSGAGIGLFISSQLLQKINGLIEKSRIKNKTIVSIVLN